MKNSRRFYLVGSMALVVVICGCTGGDQTNEEKNMTTGVNPFLVEWDGPFGTPPFDQIVPAHYIPAYEKGMADHKAEIEAIVTNPEPPTFGNTIEAYERSGEWLGRVSMYVSNQNEAHTNDETQAVVKEMAPVLSAHFTDISLNPGLFARVSAVWGQRDDLELTAEQAMLLRDTYRGFVRNGANLKGGDRDRLRAINEELSNLGVRFSDNQLAEMNAPALVIEDEADLVGLPEDVISAAAGVSTANGLDGAWAFNLQRTSWTPFLTYSDRRDLREELYRAYIESGQQRQRVRQWGDRLQVRGAPGRTRPTAGLRHSRRLRSRGAYGPRPRPGLRPARTRLDAGSGESHRGGRGPASHDR